MYDVDATGPTDRNGDGVRDTWHRHAATGSGGAPAPVPRSRRRAAMSRRAPTVPSRRLRRALRAGFLPTLLAAGLLTVGTQPALAQDIDTTPPVLTLPAEVRVTAGQGSATASVTYFASAMDDVEGPVPVVCSIPSGSSLPVGTFEVSCTATDTSGNLASGVFDVIVTRAAPPVEDTTPPVLTLPGTIMRTTTSPAGTAVTYEVSATDAVDGSVPVTCSIPSGATFAVGTTEVGCTARDENGNLGSGVFDVTVVLQAAPVPRTCATTPPPGAVRGTAGNNILNGTPGNDVIYGLGGNDIINGAGGDDVLCGGDGNDILRGGPGADVMDGGNGNDILNGDAGDDVLRGAAGNDVLNGDAGNDTLDGGTGNNALRS